MDQGLTTRVRGLLALNGVLGILVGLLGGFAFVFNIIGAVEVFPFIPRIDTQIPGSETAWRAVHSGSIMNGLLLVAIAAIGAFVRLGARGQTALLWTGVLTVWGNVIGYFTAAIGGDRGLEFGIDTLNTVAYISFFIAAIAVLVAVGLLITGIVRGLRTV